MLPLFIHSVLASFLVRNKDFPKLVKHLIRLFHIQVVVFPDETILNEPVEAWPACDAFMCFYRVFDPVVNISVIVGLLTEILVQPLHSDGHPMDKTFDYST